MHVYVKVRGRGQAELWDVASSFLKELLHKSNFLSSSCSQGQSCIHKPVPKFLKLSAHPFKLHHRHP